MYTYKRKNLPKNTVELTITIPKDTISEEYKKAFEMLQKVVEVEGFRKGKVPKDIAEKNIRKDQIFEQMIRNYIPKAYTEIVEKESLKPIISPRVDLTKAKEGEDWEVRMTTAEAPKVELGNYKEKVAAAKKAAKKNDIWVPGKDKEPTEADKEKQKQAEFQAALEALMKESKIEVSDLVLDEEIERKLARLVDDIVKVGLTMESYLKSKNTTKEEIQAQIRRETEDSYKIEFLLQEIADKENINVGKEDLDKIFGNIKDPKEKEQAEKNAYYYASLLRKQKTLDYINSL
jgi:trigger factor